MYERLKDMVPVERGKYAKRVTKENLLCKTTEYIESMNRFHSIKIYIFSFEIGMPNT